jgi:RNA polymerase sigma-70 factor (ECF subfamily)
VPPSIPRLAAREAPPRSRANLRALPEEGRVGDAELVERALGGDGSAAEGIFRRHVDAVAGLSLRLLRNRADMEDVVQETFLIALEKLPTLRDVGALRPWLLRIAISHVRRRARRNKLLSFFGLGHGEADSPLDDLASQALGPEGVAELAALDRVLAGLPDEERIAWVLRHVEGEAVEDVAFACGCSLSTAKRRIAAADARVRLHVRLGEVT